MPPLVGWGDVDNMSMVQAGFGQGSSGGRPIQKSPVIHALDVATLRTAGVTALCAHYEEGEREVAMVRLPTANLTQGTLPYSTLSKP